MGSPGNKSRYKKMNKGDAELISKLAELNSRTNFLFSLADQDQPLPVIEMFLQEAGEVLSIIDKTICKIKEENRDYHRPHNG